MNHPVILIGNARSGTSILSHLMRDWLGIAFPTESQFIIKYFERQEAYRPLEDLVNLRRLVEHLLSERWLERSHKFNKFTLTVDEVIAHVEVKTYAGVLDAIFSCFADHVGLQRWGDKTPGYIHHLDVIYELFPDAKYVHLVRDGRDVALSLSKTYFGSKNPYTAAMRWRDTIDKGGRFAEKLPPDQIITLRYEDMLTEPGEFFGQLIDFLHVPGDRAKLISQIRGGLSQRLMTDNSNKWKREWSREQVATFERYAGSQLRRHGYETLTECESLNGTKWQACLWRSHDELMKWKFPAYWSDNVYKVKCRVKDLFQR
ncbi:sulfotransferase family protein [Roseiconus nitratireducens]|uniref:sulfotransferase family protein n=1 Tax=Roseiconus nitratireducens TaxID=2605748 RepID=UPI0013756CBC|nr:sulfotransferase [Roseiconus nitratireducens]